MEQNELQKALKKLPPELRQAIGKGVKQAEDGPMEPGEAARHLTELGMVLAKGGLTPGGLVAGLVPAVISIIMERTEHRLRRRIRRRTRRIHRALERGDIEKAMRISERLARAEERLDRLLARKR